jgi:Mce-associated membrane protein
VVALAVAVVALLGILAAQGWYLWLAGELKPTAERPVTVSDLSQATAVDAARAAAEEILSTSWEDYDAQAEQAKSLMTETYAIEYDETSDDIKDAFVAARTAVDMRVVWAGVYRASAEQVQALLFLDQVVTRGESGLRTTPYRALVTVVSTDRGWLVSAIETR